jgi:hypothetical protein
MSKHEATHHQHYGVIMGVGLLPDFSAAHTGAALESANSLSRGGQHSLTHCTCWSEKKIVPRPLWQNFEPKHDDDARVPAALGTVKQLIHPTGAVASDASGASRPSVASGDSYLSAVEGAAPQSKF